MRFAFDEDPLLLQATLRTFLERECPPDRIRALWETATGRSPALWKELAELGVLGLLAPEAQGGLGRDEVDFVLLHEELGRAGIAEPVVATAAVAVPLLAGLSALAERWTKPIAVGEAVVAVGHPVSRFVADAHVAALLLLERDGLIHAVPPERAEIVREAANDPARRIFSVRFRPSPESLVAGGETARALLDAALDRGALASAAQQIGVTERLLDLAVRHACVRRQFDRPIGSFQAVKHQLADAKIALEYARPGMHRAADSVARGSPRRALHVSMAKAAADEAAAFAARVALQVHGAIGYTWDHDLHVFMRRAWSLGREWGDATFHRARVAEAVLGGMTPIGPGTTF